VKVSLHTARIQPEPVPSETDPLFVDTDSS